MAERSSPWASPRTRIGAPLQSRWSRPSKPSATNLLLRHMCRSDAARRTRLGEVFDRVDHIHAIVKMGAVARRGTIHGERVVRYLLSGTGGKEHGPAAQVSCVVVPHYSRQRHWGKADFVPSIPFETEAVCHGNVPHRGQFPNHRRSARRRLNPLHTQRPREVGSDHRPTRSNAMPAEPPSCGWMRSTRWKPTTGPHGLISRWIWRTPPRPSYSTGWVSAMSFAHKTKQSPRAPPMR